ncbi:MAG: NADP-dependent oxidoreductase [Pseudomonadales bacterium]|jgi:NADPH-dependent curcumin reductase CurA|nr:NADP-dependent oxidoreductase [Pseudomonadales bacterium]
MSIAYQRFVIDELPKGPLEERHFRLEEGVLPALEAGQVAVRVILISQDAANRAWLQGATYRGAVQTGDVMPSGAIAEVLASEDPAFAPGALVYGDIGWQSHAIMPGAVLRHVGPHRPLTHHLSLLGVAGKTAYHGLFQAAGIHAGETLLVSAAAGSVGSLVGQLGKLKGARVIGVAGGPEKCAWVRDTLGFDECLDYRDESRPLPKALAAAAPEGVDAYFDNTGGPILQAALFAMREQGRIACCGAVSMYDGAPRPGPVGVPGLIVVKRLTLKGFIVSDYAHLDADAEHELALWAKQGQLHMEEDILEGLEAAPRGLIGLLAGQNRGKRMVRLAPDPA